MMTKQEEKAIELVEMFKDHVNPYIGSGMLSNTCDDRAIVWQAKQCAVKTENEAHERYYRGIEALKVTGIIDEKTFLSLADRIINEHVIVITEIDKLY